MAVSNSIVRIIEETLPVIVLFAVVGIFTGGFLRDVLEEASYAPGILILVPGMLGLRGNISSALGARLCSALHLGYISSKKISRDLLRNIEVSISLSIFISFILSIFAWLVCSYTGGPCMSVWGFMSVSVLTGVMSGSILSFMTSGIAIISYRKGLDPDNITLPAGASIGDVVTIICLLLAVRLIMGLGI